MLFFDTAQQARASATIASVDTSNCYDRIAHAIASLVFQAFGLPELAIESMLGTIESMKFFLRTGFGDLNNLLAAGSALKSRVSFRATGPHQQGGRLSAS
jgi:hypothetical protein